MCSLIYFALPILLFIAPFTHVLPRPTRRRRGPIYRIRIHEYPQNGVAIHHTVPTNTHQMALQFVIFRTSRQIEKERSKPMMFASLLCFMC